MTNGFSSYASLGYYFVTGSVANARLAESVRNSGARNQRHDCRRPQAQRLRNRTFAYSIVSGNDGGTFAMDDSGNLVVANNQLLDYFHTSRLDPTRRSTRIGGQHCYLLNPSLSETNRRVLISVLPMPGPPVITEQPPEASRSPPP